MLKQCKRVTLSWIASSILSVIHVRFEYNLSESLPGFWFSQALSCQKFLLFLGQFRHFFHLLPPFMLNFLNKDCLWVTNKMGALKPYFSYNLSCYPDPASRVLHQYLECITDIIYCVVDNLPSPADKDLPFSALTLPFVPHRSTVCSPS